VGTREREAATGSSRGPGGLRGVDWTTWRAALRSPWTWVVLAGCVLVVFTSFAGAAARLDRDEGAFITIAQEIVHGRMPYRDAFDQKGPGIYYVLAAVLALTPRLAPLQQLLVARGLTVVVNFVSALGIYAFCRRWWRADVALLAALLWLFTLPFYLGNQFFTESFANAPTIWAAVVASGRPGERPGWRRALGSGLLLALATLFKQTAILALPGVALLLLAGLPHGARWWQPTRDQLVAFGELLAGFVAPWLALGVVFAAFGGLSPLIDQVVIANIRYPSDRLSDVISLAKTGFGFFRLIWLAALAAVAYGLWRWLGLGGAARRIPSVGAIAAVVIGALNLLPFKSHAYYHYWLQVLPWAAILSALSLAGIVHLATEALGRREAGALAATPRLLAVPVLLTLVIVFATTRSISPTNFKSDYGGLQSQAAVGTWIAAHTTPDARLLVAPAQPEFYFLSGHVPVTTYIYLLPVNFSDSLVGQVSDDLNAERFDLVAWQSWPDLQSDTSCNPPLGDVCQALHAHYHVVDMDQTEEITLYAPNTPRT
jgi:hypothetical protein